MKTTDNKHSSTTGLETGGSDSIQKLVESSIFPLPAPDSQDVEQIRDWVLASVTRMVVTVLPIIALAPASEKVEELHNALLDLQDSILCSILASASDVPTRTILGPKMMESAIAFRSQPEVQQMIWDLLANKVRVEQIIKKSKGE